MHNRIEILQELITKLEAFAVKEDKLLQGNDTNVMQSLYNMYHYLQSNVDYDASGQIEMIRFEIDGCSDEVKALVSPMLTNKL